MSQLIVEILDSFLGTPHRHNDSSGQLQYDCPSCAEYKGLASGDGKGNLEVNYHKGVFKCWSCYDTHNMSGSLHKLIKKYGNSRNIRDYELIDPFLYLDKEVDIPDVVLTLPDGYVELTGCDPTVFRYKEVMTYLKDRGITNEIIEKYRIGFTTIGEYANRVIIPSYNQNNELDFFVGRGFKSWVKPKYLNPKVEKQLINFNESKINWDATIYLVEGVFDGIVLPNSIIMLGKIMSDKLYYDLQYKSTGMVVIALDGDAKEDAKYLYKKLNSMNLYNRVLIINLREDLDMSLINQKYKQKGILKVLKTAHKIPESQL